MMSFGVQLGRLTFFHQRLALVELIKLSSNFSLSTTLLTSPIRADTVEQCFRLSVKGHELSATFEVWMLRFAPFFAFTKPP